LAQPEHTFGALASFHTGLGKMPDDVITRGASLSLMTLSLLPGVREAYVLGKSPLPKGKQ
jgi:hypothetical protein